MTKRLPTNVGIGLFDGRKGLHLEHVAADIVKAIIKSVQEGIHSILLNQLIVLLNIRTALHWVGLAEVYFTPDTLQFGVKFLRRTAGLSQASNTSPKFVDLGSIAAVEIGSSNGIPNRFGSGKSDEIAD